MIKYLITIILFLIIILSQFAFAQDEYTPTVLFVIPWGNDPGELSMDFQTSETMEVFEPGPYAVSENGDLVIFDHKINAEKTYVSKMMIKKFDSNGNLIAFRDIEDYGILLFRPWEIAILNSGEVAVSSSCVPQQIFLLDASLNLLHEITLPYSEPWLDKFTPTAYDSFWLAFMVLEEINGNEFQQYYKTEIFLDGSYSTPEITWDDVSNTGIPAHYISPTGEPFLCNADMYGYVYRSNHENSSRKLYKSKLNELGTEYDLVYTHTSVSDPGWEWFENAVNTGEKHFVTWQGDFYTIHATDAGMVLTKYTLNHDPVCDLLVVTPMPYQGPSPAAIEFDASNTYDPNPDDELTFEWDFDGDGVFNEPVDDAYTGDPDNPTHEYTTNYDGFVTVRVTDGHDGECDSSVYISVVIQ